MPRTNLQEHFPATVHHSISRFFSTEIQRKSAKFHAESRNFPRMNRRHTMTCRRAGWDRRPRQHEKGSGSRKPLAAGPEQTAGTLAGGNHGKLVLVK
jgi:hypothetical protein